MSRFVSLLDSSPAQKFSVKDFFSKFNQIHREPRVWSQLLKKFLMENFIFCSVVADESRKKKNVINK